MPTSLPRLTGGPEGPRRRARRRCIASTIAVQTVEMRFAFLPPSTPSVVPDLDVPPTCVLRLETMTTWSTRPSKAVRAKPVRMRKPGNQGGGARVLGVFLGAEFGNVLVTVNPGARAAGGLDGAQAADQLDDEFLAPGVQLGAGFNLAGDLA